MVLAKLPVMDVYCVSISVAVSLPSMRQLEADSSHSFVDSATGVRPGDKRFMCLSGYGAKKRSW